MAKTPEEFEVIWQRASEWERGLMDGKSISCAGVVKLWDLVNHDPFKFEDIIAQFREEMEEDRRWRKAFPRSDRLI